MSLEIETGPNAPITPKIVNQTGDNQSPLQIYLSEVERYPILNQDQQKSLFKYLRSGLSTDDLRRDGTFEPHISSGDERYFYAFQQSQTLEELALGCNLGLVVAEARRYPRIPTLDLIQEGNIGLMKAVERYDPELGRFPSYARWWIKGAMFNAMPDLIRSAHIPGGMRRRINIVRDVETELSNNYGNKPSEQELLQAVHDRTGLSDRAINTVLGIMSSGVMYITSLDRGITPDSEVTLYDFIPDGSTGVEQEAIGNIEDKKVDGGATIDAENGAFRNRRRPGAREAAANMGKSIPTAQRALRRLVEAGLLPLHPRDPKTVDETGFTEHTRRLDTLVEEILKGDPKKRNKELTVLLADPNMLGVRISTVTIERSRLRLANAGRTERRILDAAFYETLDAYVEERLKTGATYKQIADDLGQPMRRVKSSGYRLRKYRRAESRARGGEMREAVVKYLEKHEGEKINRSAIARQLGITREWVRQIYDDLQSRSTHTD